MIKIIHVGKSGGSSLRKLLRNNDIKHQSIHMDYTVDGKSNAIVQRSKNLKKGDKNVLLLRDPVDRVLSVFNFWLDISMNQEKRLKSDRKHYKQYMTKYNISDFFEKLYEDKFVDKVMGEVNHFKEGLYYYCNNVNSVDKITDVIRQEHLNSDIKRVFNLKNDVHRNKTTHYSKDISDKALENIKKYCTNDYKVIDWLLEAKLIDNNYVNKFK